MSASGTCASSGPSTSNTMLRSSGCCNGGGAWPV
jgi:hypothetical protein